MRYLLDTHTLLWFIADDRRLSANARELIESQSNDIFISAASLWEIAIKVNIGKLVLDKPFERVFPEELRLNNIEILNITIDSLIRLTTLPLHHRDPFDRLIIAQVLIGSLLIIGVDENFDTYGINREW